MSDKNKKAEELLRYWQKQLNQEYPEPYEYPTVSADYRTKELRDLNYKTQKIKQETRDNLESLKYNNFWTLPYSNFSGEQAVGLGSNLAKPVVAAGLTAGPLKKIYEVVNFLKANPNILNNMVGSVAAGAGTDMAYEKVTGKPAQLGESLDIQNPYTRELLNFISPGAIVGNAISIPYHSKVKLPTTKDVDELYNLVSKYANFRNIQIPEKPSGTPIEVIDILSEWAKKNLKKEAYYRGIDVNANLLNFAKKHNIDMSSIENFVKDIISRVPSFTGAGRKGLAFESNKNNGSYVSDSFKEALYYSKNPETLIPSTNSWIAVLKRKYDYSRPSKELLEQAVKVDYEMPELSNIQELLKARTQPEFKRILEYRYSRNPVKFTQTEKYLEKLLKKPRQLSNLKHIVKNTPDNYFVVQPSKKGFNNYVNIGNEGDVVWDVVKVMNVNDLK